MPLTAQTPFQTAALRHWLQQETLALAPECAGVFGRQGLFIGCEQGFGAALSSPMLGRRFGLHMAAPGQLAGDVHCAAAELPFADESFRLIVLQHAFEWMDDAAALRAELVRVLEPGGILMVSGFARFGPWRPWLAWRVHRFGGLRCASAGSWRRALAQDGVDTYSQRRIGLLQADSLALALPSALRPSWLLLARKRSQAALTRVRPVSLKPRGVRARLASGTQRASA